jgi:branched-chain amino acid transport system permease protein
MDNLQLLASGIATGSIYALIGLALTLTYSTTRVINFAVGEMAMLAAMSASTLVATGMPLAVAGLGGVAIGCATGLVMYLLAIRPAQRRGATVLTLVIVTLAVHMFLEGIGLILWGTTPRALPAFTGGDPVHFGSVVLERQSLWVVAATAVILVALHRFFFGTMLGRALRACAVNPTGSRLMGISVVRMGALAFVLAGALAGVAGLLIDPATFAQYDMGLNLAVKGFVAAVIGMMVRPGQAVVGGLLLGMLEGLAAGNLASGYRDMVAFVVLIAVLLWRAAPALRQGILAVAEENRD